MSRSLTLPRIMIILAVTLLGSTSLAATAGEVYGYAIVTERGLIKVQGRVYRLHGIDIPTLSTVCGNSVNRISCEVQAAVRALNSRIHGFVRCVDRWENRDGTVTGNCYYEDEDLGAFLVKTGRAAATEDAPPQYHLLERIARRQGRGIWSFATDISEF